jgi:signal transduction histidine kinase
MYNVTSIRSMVRSVPLLANFKKRYILPRSSDPDQRNREIVLNTLLLSTTVVLGMAIFLLCISFALLHNEYVVGRMAAISCVLLVTLGIYWLSRQNHIQLAAGLLVGIYFLLAVTMSYRWGVDLPVALVLYALIITFAGILLGATYSLVAAVCAIGVLVAIAWASGNGLIVHDHSWASNPTSANMAGDIVGFSLVLSVLAIVCWLFNFQMERSLHRALKAEAELAGQKANLEIKFAERTHELHVSQAEKLQQMYRFAEFGQLSAALLHELANHMTTLHLDIEDLQQQNKSGILERAKTSMAYLDEMVRQVRDQLKGKSGITTFVIADEISKVVGILHQKSLYARVKIEWDPQALKKTAYVGDSTRLRHLIAILISNAIDAYTGLETTDRRVVISVNRLENSAFVIAVEDFGKGISASKLKTIFEPFYGTKKTGMGLGLFIAKQLTEDYFHGLLRVQSTSHHTVFTVTIPKT